VLLGPEHVGEVGSRDKVGDQVEWVIEEAMEEVVGSRDVEVAVVMRTLVGRIGAMTSRAIAARRGRIRTRTPIAVTTIRAIHGVVIGEPATMESSTTSVTTMKAETVPMTLVTGITSPTITEETEIGMEMVGTGTTTRQTVMEETETGTEIVGMETMTPQTTTPTTSPTITPMTTLAKTTPMPLQTYPVLGMTTTTATMTMIIMAIPRTALTTVAGTSLQSLLAGPLTMATLVMIRPGEETTQTPTMTIMATGTILMGISRTATPTIAPITSPATTRIGRTAPITKTIPKTEIITLATNPAILQAAKTTQPGTQQLKQHSAVAAGITARRDLLVEAVEEEMGGIGMEAAGTGEGITTPATMKAIGAGIIAITPTETETDTGTGGMARGAARGTEMEKARVIVNGGLPKSKRHGRIRPWLLIRVIGSRRIGILEGERRLGGGGP
jgi:hypothetical protein